METQVLDPIQRLTRDIRAASATLSRGEARFLVDAYYQMQEDRKRSSNQVRALSESGEPHEVLAWLAQNTATLERNIKNALDAFSTADFVGCWAKTIIGIGPVIAAGLSAHIDIEKAPTCGHIWRFAGVDPTVEWLGRDRAKSLVASVDGPLTPEVTRVLATAANLNPEHVLRLATVKATGEEQKLTRATLTAALSKRPWNAKLKVLCWKIGESFVKTSNNDADVYGHLWAERKAQEVARNEAGDFADQAAAKLKRFKIGKSTEAYKAYAAGKLPPGHLHARAKRWAVKLFLAHWQTVAYRHATGRMPPKPYVLARLGHVHEIQVPNWPF